MNIKVTSLPAVRFLGIGNVLATYNILGLMYTKRGTQNSYVQIISKSISRFQWGKWSQSHANTAVSRYYY